MNRSITLRLGVVPVKRGPGFTSAKDCLIPKNNAMEAMKSTDHPVEFVTIDEVVPDGIATDPAQVPEIVSFLKNKKVDAVFIIHTDFGSEEVIAKVGKAMGLPLLLWGERDSAPDADGIRIRDTQCGIFAASKVLAGYKVPFTYIENCYAKDDTFKQGVENFCRTASVIKALRSHGEGMKILKIGERPSSFISVMSNEAELLNKFGIEVIPLPVSRLVNQVDKLKKEAPAELKEQMKSIKERIAIDKFGEEKLATLAALIVFIRQEMQALNAAAASIECWSGLSQFFGFVPCQVIGELGGLGYPLACEGDICGAVTAALLHAADYNRGPVFFADLTIRHPENDNAELLWHCGPFPHKLIRDNEKPWIDEGGRGQWKLKDGDLTLIRFDSLEGEYSMFIGSGKTTEGPKSTGTYVWLEVDDWPKWERKLVEGPYIHHSVGIYGNFSKALQEACKYIPGLKADPV